MSKIPKVPKVPKMLKITKNTKKQCNFFLSVKTQNTQNESTKKVDYFWTENIVLSQCVSCKGSRLRKRLSLEHQDCPEGHFPKLNFILKVKRERV